MRVIVIGGGAVGLCVAEAASHRGAEVTVLERDRCGLGASAGNAGWITPSLSAPVPGPGVITASLKWLVDPSGPLWIRPTLDPALLEWIARFLVSCPRPVYRRGLIALQTAVAHAGPAFDRLAERGVNFELHHEPLLNPCYDSAELHHLEHVAQELREAGSLLSIEPLSKQELRGLEPAIGEHAIGGLIAHGESRVRPERLTAGLRNALIQAGAKVIEGSSATGLQRGNTGWHVQTPTETHEADAVVLAAGVDSARLLAGLSLRLPLAAAKGYSRTYPRDPTGPQRPVYLEDAKVSVSVYDEGVRISGTLELGARTLAVSNRRLTAITEASQAAMPGWRMDPSPRDWAGMRSLSPDGLPYIGPVPGHDGLHLATAHATLGITLGPLTGEWLASQLLEPERSGIPRAFFPARALRSGRPQHLTTGGPS